MAEHSDPVAYSEMTLDELRPVLVEAMLPHVPFEGWSVQSAQAAAVDLGLKPALVGLVFRNGPIDMVEAYLRLADARMLQALDTPDYKALKVREKVATAIRTRLEQARAHREAVRRISTLLARPYYAPKAAQFTWQTADAIWRAAGDTATDFNHYSKRAMGGAVYASTLMVWLNDDSEDFADTWAFLDRRIDNVMQIEKVKGKLRGKAESRGEGLSLSRFLGRLRYPAA